MTHRPVRWSVPPLRTLIVFFFVLFSPIARVVNIKDLPANWREDPAYVFVGRPSHWGNPYRLSQYDRATAIRLYENYINNCMTKNKLSKLAGKMLVCFCAPLRCHGDVLARRVNETVNHEEL
jgi:hypothetical protein